MATQQQHKTTTATITMISVRLFFLGSGSTGGKSVFVVMMSSPLKNY